MEGNRVGQLFGTIVWHLWFIFKFNLVTRKLGVGWIRRGGVFFRHGRIILSVNKMVRLPRLESRLS
ncbi:hypothetical protein THIOM_001145 [Candidatus Thiomargarita nelsonii]|uniref:Uncharacterized protein n=1 Tax=Candidatus Thiomargarita nelsonii TaxID=1003181 RepID=A0A176S4Z2_9GAMM|nr:hypothetical protein THIOM_001145 [Candidatus Thiomargarita nelsonii]